VLSDELVAITEVVSDVPANVVGARHQHVDEVVDNDRDLRTIDRLEPG
jgi:hypothetical protein